LSIMNMPGFSANASLYKRRTQYNISDYQRHHLNSTLLARGKVIPQLPLYIGRFCEGGCVIQGVHQGGGGGCVSYGTRTCCNYFADPNTGDFRKNSCRTVGCTGDAWPC